MILRYSEILNVGESDSLILRDYEIQSLRDYDSMNL